VLARSGRVWSDQHRPAPTLAVQAFGTLVIVYAKRSGWTLYSAAVSRAAWPWFVPTSLQWTEESFGDYTDMVHAYVKLAMTILLPVQLLLFPTVWLLAKINFVPNYVIDALHAEEHYALWVMSAIATVGTLVPLYRRHGIAVFCLSIWVLVVCVVTIFTISWAIHSPTAGLAAFCFAAAL
jgi:hypothetical protein